MARIPIPNGYTNWNDYSNTIADANPDQSIEARRLIKRDIKLGLIASDERYANGNTSSSSYRQYHIYETPGTVSPAVGHPWLLNTTFTGSILLTESGNSLTDESGNILIME